MKERYESIANVQGISNEVFKMVLEFMYTGSIQLNENNVMDILLASDYLQIDSKS